MNRSQLRQLEDKVINCQLLHTAIHALESLRDSSMPDGLAKRWIDEIKEEAGLQISQHDEDRHSILDNVDVDASALNQTT